jgi:hypothetical protein
LTDNNDYLNSAIEMADWELSVQMDCGAIQSGTIDVASKSPTIFNTGQVLFGWATAFEETGDEKYREADLKAAN